MIKFCIMQLMDFVFYFSLLTYTLYTVVFTHPKPLPATTSLQLEPANNVFEPDNVSEEVRG